MQYSPVLEVHNVHHLRIRRLLHSIRREHHPSHRLSRRPKFVFSIFHFLHGIYVGFLQPSGRKGMTSLGRCTCWSCGFRTWANQLIIVQWIVHHESDGFYHIVNVLSRRYVAMKDDHVILSGYHLRESKQGRPTLQVCWRRI